MQSEKEYVDRRKMIEIIVNPFLSVEEKLICLLDLEPDLVCSIESEGGENNDNS